MDKLIEAVAGSLLKQSALLQAQSNLLQSMAVVIDRLERKIDILEKNTANMEIKNNERAQ